MAGWIPIDSAIPPNSKRIRLDIDPMGSYDYDWAYWAEPEFLVPFKLHE